MKWLKIIAAFAMFAVMAVAFARSGGTNRPVCWAAGRNAMRVIDLRNHGSTREEARRALYIPTMGQSGNTPEWIVRDIIDPHLRVAYETPASRKVDPDASGEAVFRECQVAEAGARN